MNSGVWNAKPQPLPPAPKTNTSPSTETKVLDSIGLVSGIATTIATNFGHGTIGGAIGEYATLAPVFAGLFDTIRGLFSHHAGK